MRCINWLGEAIRNWVAPDALLRRLFGLSSPETGMSRQTITEVYTNEELIIAKRMYKLQGLKWVQGLRVETTHVTN